MQFEGFGLRFAGCRVQVAGWLKTAGKRLKVEGCSLKNKDCRMNVEGCRTQVVSSTYSMDIHLVIKGGRGQYFKFLTLTRLRPCDHVPYRNSSCPCKV